MAGSLFGKSAIPDPLAPSSPGTGKSGPMTLANEQQLGGNKTKPSDQEQICLSDRCSQDRKANALVVFFGGFGDNFTSSMTGTYKNAELPGAKKIYFPHDQGIDAALKIRQFLKNNPSVPLILVGHSMGGMTAIETARTLISDISVQLLVTLDPVRVINLWSKTPQKPENVESWVNVYTTKGANDFENWIESFDGDFDGKIKPGVGVISVDANEKGGEDVITHGFAESMYNHTEVEKALKTALGKKVLRKLSNSSQKPTDRYHRK